MKLYRKLINLLIGFVLVLIVLVIDTATVSAGTDFIPFVGSNGTDNGQFICPYYVAVDNSGNVYVSDSGNNRIQKFNSNGNYVTQWGSSGTGNGQFSSPMGITVDSDGNILVVDYINDPHIQKFDPNGNFLARWGSQGFTDGQFDRPDGIAVDSSGNVYVTDNTRKYIQKFDSNGNFLAKYSGPGTADNQLGNPKGIAIDSSDNIYVVDNGNNCIKKFDSEGVFQFKWGSNGTGDGQFNMPYGIATDSSGNVYVVDGGNCRIQKFDSNGIFQEKWGSNGSNIGQLFYPKGMTVDSSGNVYVADYANCRVQVLAPSLEATSTIKGQTIYFFGTPSLMLGNVAAGAITITAERAADTTGAAPYATLFDKGDANAVVKVVKYAAGGDTGSFDTATAYAGEAVTNGDFFIVRLTATEGTKVVYYKIIITVSAPEKPVILSDTSGDDCVDINWSAVAGATGYNIYRSTTPGSYGTALASVGGAVTSYGESGIVSGTTYYYVVKAVNSGGESIASNEISITLIDAVAPVITTGLTDKTTVEGTGITLDATATVSDGGTLSYVWYSADDADKTNAQAITGATGATYSPSAGTVGEFYYYCEVTNTNNAVTGAKTAVTTSAVSKVTVVEAVPDAPKIQSVIAGDGYANITWSEVTGAIGYKIFSSTTSGVYGNKPAATVTDSVYSCDIKGLKNGTEYYFAIKATNTGGDSAFSNEMSATPQVDAPEAPTDACAIAGDAKVNLSWNTVANATGYKIFSSTTKGTYGDSAATVTGSVYSHDVTGLENGIEYYFVVSAENPGGDSGYSNEVSATPMSVPGVPTDVTAEAGNGQATVSFTAPSDNGGSPITGYIVTANPGGKTAAGEDTPITVTGLTNGTAYTFTVKAVNAVGAGEGSEASSPVIPHGPSDRDDTEDEDTSAAPATPIEPTKPSVSGVEILVNGRPETAAESTTTTTGGKTVITIKVDDKKVEDKLQTEGNKAVVTIPVMNSADVVVGQLNGQTVKNMEAKEAVLEIKTENVTYTLPATQINIDDVSSQIGEQVELKDIAVNISISVPTQDTVRIIEDTADRNNYQIVVKPVEFSITCTNGNKKVEVSRFKGYVERMVAIPEGVDPGRITTGVVLNPDGTFSHVPTTIIVVGGKYYAKINSLTNSTYSVVYSPKTFKDVENHWAKDAVNDMGSRLVIDGTGEDKFEPDRDMTRAEFAAIMVRALGLMRPGTGKDTFDDVARTDWYYDAVSIAYEYGIISGYGSREFGPNDKVTREHAMIMIARAMDITGLKTEPANAEADKLLENFADAGATADYAKNSIAANIKAGIVTGRNGETLAPKDSITRAETAVIIRRLLQRSGLI